MADTTTAPTEAEIQAAQELLQRAASVRQKEINETRKPLTDITSSPEFAKLREMVENLSKDFYSDMTIAPHIMALRAGFNGLATVAPPIPAEGAPEPA